MKIITSNTNSFIFKNIFNNEQCIVTINIQEKQYNTKSIYYYINYSYYYSYNNNTFASLSNEIRPSHPFYKTNRLDHKEGDIICKNSMTEQMIKYLLMEYDELKKYSGQVEPETYKKNIMLSLSYLWD